MRFFWLLLVALGLGTKRHWHILFAIILGVALGIFFPAVNYTGNPGYQFFYTCFESIGEIFIRLITMLVIPLVVSSLIVGISSLGDARQLGRMGSKVLFFFALLMILSAVLGGLLGVFVKPGEQLKDTIATERVSMRHQTAAPRNVEAQPGNTATSETPATEASTAVATRQPTPALPAATTATQADIAAIQKASQEKFEFFSIIPKNVVQSLAQMDLVPVVVFTLFFGLAISFIGDAGKPLISLFEAIFAATMKMTDWVMVLAVPGVFSLAFASVASAGPEIFVKLAPFALVVIAGLLIQMFVIFPILLRVLAKIDFFNLYRAISEAIMVAFGTASSSATLPVTIACCERRAGISNRIASFVLPTAASINKTGTTMFEVLAVMFLAQAYGIPMDNTTIALIVVFAIFASIGAAGVPSTGMVTMAIVLNSIGGHFSLTDFGAGIALLWSIDRALDMCRTVVNVVSGCTVAALVASSEGELQRGVLNNQESWTEIV